jgi:hypothetical protein
LAEERLPQHRAEAGADKEVAEVAGQATLPQQPQDLHNNQCATLTCKGIHAWVHILVDSGRGGYPLYGLLLLSVM